MLQLKNRGWRERGFIAQVFEDRANCLLFWLVERGELMVNRGDLCGSCVVIFGVDFFSIFEDLFSVGRTEG